MVLFLKTPLFSRQSFVSAKNSKKWRKDHSPNANHDKFIYNYFVTNAFLTFVVRRMFSKTWENDFHKRQNPPTTRANARRVTTRLKFQPIACHFVSSSASPINTIALEGHPFLFVPHIPQSTTLEFGQRLQPHFWPAVIVTILVQ